jgi:hypothetical protein
MSQLVSVMRAWSSAGGSRTIRIPSTVALTNLAPGYTLHQWRNDPETERDQKTLFRLFSTRSPELEDVLDEVREAGIGSELLFEGRAAQGLLAGWLLGGLAVSWRTGSIWDRHSLSCYLTEIGPEAELVKRTVEVSHAARPEHANAWFATWKLELDQSRLDGQAILAAGNELFPALRFVGSAARQLVSWGPNRDGWPFVLRAFRQLQTLCAEWGDHPFAHEKISSPCSPESSRVDENPTLRSYREFVCEDGVSRYFTWHIKHYKLNLRLHYHCDESIRIVRIGHIGDHLPLG